MVHLSKDHVINLLKRASVEPLSLPVPPAVDHADHMLKTALAGYTKLAADHILHHDMNNMLLDVLGSFIRRANLVIRSESLSNTNTDLETLNTRILRRARIYDTVLELIMNLIGVESRWSGFDEETIEEAITIFD
ncbi:MAG: hypothetical protein QXX52_08525 [Ignisphaera sp.]